MRWLKDLSFPHRIIALVIAIILVVGTLYLTSQFVFGTITIISPQQEAQVSLQNDIYAYPLPHSYRLKPGKYTFALDAPGHVEKRATLTNYAFLKKQYTVTLLPNVNYENAHVSIQYTSEKQVYIIVPKIDFPIPDDPKAQLASQWNIYEKYAKEALDYIKSRGVDPKTLPIEWWLQDWWPTGKRIEY